MELIKTTIDKIFPKQCINCWKIWDYLCSECRQLLKPHPEECPVCHKYNPNYKICPDCFSNEIYYDWVIKCFKYNNILKILILKLKYWHRREIAEFLSKRLEYMILTNDFLSKKLKKEIFYISFIPIYRHKKLFKRGYNQSKILAHNLAKNLDLEFKKLCIKSKNTKSQTKLKRKERIQNIKNSFIINPKEEIKQPANILLIDDLTTTNSTINETAKCIKTYFPKTRIRWVVIWKN